LLAEKTGENINDSEVANVSDMKTSTGRIRKHFGEEHFWDAGFFDGFEGLGFFPFLLPFCFNFEGFVSIHLYIISLLSCLGE